MIDETDEIKKKTIYHLYEFLLHIIVAAIIFSVIAVVAVCFNISIIFLKSKGVEGIIIYGLSTAEYALFLGEVILFLRLLFKSGLRLWRKL